MPLETPEMAPERTETRTMSQTLPRAQIDGLDFTITGAIKVDTARVQMSRYAWFDRDFDGCLWICQPISWSWGH